MKTFRIKSICSVVWAALILQRSKLIANTAIVDLAVDVETLLLHDHMGVAVTLQQGRCGHHQLQLSRRVSSCRLKRFRQGSARVLSAAAMWVWNLMASAPASAAESMKACAMPRLPSWAWPTSAIMVQGAALRGLCSQVSVTWILGQSWMVFRPSIISQRRENVSNSARFPVITPIS